MWATTYYTLRNLASIVFSSNYYYLLSYTSLAAYQSYTNRSEFDVKTNINQNTEIKPHQKHQQHLVN